MTSHAAPLGPDGDTVALEKAVELVDYAAQDLSSSTVSSRKGGAEAAAAGHIVAASVYFATTIPYSSDFFCDG